MSKPSDKPSPFLFKFFLAVAAISVLIFGYSNTINSPNNPKNKPQQQLQTQSSKQLPKQDPRQIILAASFGKGQIAIRNDNDFNWTGARIVVANGPTNQYELKVGTIKSGETKQYSLSEFVSSSGEIYDSRKYVPKQVFVYADNASGGKQY